ncbi:hypothetical protein [Leisingera aquimarina]|uniref:hypothetical protein n=1 Tax=Leisingera aquimarina TaxID=476529 RepID=UPI0004232B0F|nr:hypothetical protein [Leisingera aquimarina]
MTNDKPIPRPLLIVGSAIALTTAAEIFYLVVWGMVLFPAGDWAGKVVWTLTCGLAMGAVIGTLTLLWVEPRYAGRSALLRAALVVAVIGSYCAWLCSRIDIRFGYFGGAEESSLFILSGVIPAVLGGLFYGWIVAIPRQNG